MSWEILEVLVAWASCWFHQQEESSAEASPDKCTCRNWKFTCSSCFILFVCLLLLLFFNDAKWCKHCYVTYINACTMRPAQAAGTGEKFQHNWVVSVVSGFHELTIRKLRQATTSNSQQTRPRLSSAPCGNAFMSSSLVDNTLECQTCEMNDSCRWLHRL